MHVPQGPSPIALFLAQTPPNALPPPSPEPQPRSVTSKVSTPEDVFIISIISSFVGLGMKLFKVKTGWRITDNRVFSWMFATGSSLCPPLAESQLMLNSSLIQVCLPPCLLSDLFLCSFLTQKSDFLGLWSTLSSEKPCEVRISGWKLEKLPPPHLQNSVWLHRF